MLCLRWLQRAHHLLRLLVRKAGWLLTAGPFIARRAASVAISLMAKAER